MVINIEKSAPSTLRVCQLISSFRPVIGGAERATEQLTIMLINGGVDTVLLTRRQSRDWLPFETISGVPVYRLGYPVRNRLGALTYALQGFWLLATRLRPYRIIHMQSPDTPLLLGFLAKVILGRKLILTIHGGNRIREYSRSKLGKIRLSLIKKLVNHCTALTSEIKEQFLALGVSLSCITLIPNGIDVKSFIPPVAAQRLEARKRLNLPETSRVVLFLGRLDEVKRVDLLLHAWERLSHDPLEQLLIVGSGPELERLSNLTVELKINVRFEGSTDNVLPYLHAADVFVLPSGIRSTASYEGLSVALMEAMSTGLAVLATDCPGNQVLIRNGYNGLLFPAEDVDELTRQLGRLLGDVALRTQLGRNARCSVYQDYAIESVAQKTRLVYQRF